MITQSIENLCASQDVESDKQDIIRQQHKRSKVVGNPALAECVVAKVANILDLRVLHDELVHGDGGDPEENAGAEHGEDAGDPAEDGEGPGLGHDGETDLVATEKPGGFLPGHGAKLDVMLVVYQSVLGMLTVNAVFSFCSPSATRAVMVSMELAPS